MLMTADQVKKALTLAEASELLRGRGGKRPSLGTMRRWANPRRGCRVPGREEPLVLTTVRWGQDILTLPEWVEAFAQARAATPPVAPICRQPRTREAEVRSAAKRLDKAGVK